MKNRFSLSKLLATLAAIGACCTAPAAITTWNVTGGLWSVGNNWDTLQAPGTADDARFVNTGAGTPTTLDASRTINSLAYAQDNQSTHTTTISAGQTLSLTRTTAGDVLNVGSTSASISASTLVPVVVTGAGGALSLSGTGDLVVRQGHSTAGTHLATLDLSGLDTLTAAVGRLLIGQANAGAAVNRPSGTLLFARTNHLTLTGASPQVMLQDSGSNANGGTASAVSFGQLTEVFGDVMRWGGQKGNANLGFNGSFSSPTLKLRGPDGSSRSSTIDFGYNGAANSGNNTVVVADFSLGSLDLYANLVNLAIGNPGPNTGQCTSTLTMGAGMFDVNTLEIAYGIATGANGVATATFNVNNNGLFSTGAVVVVNTSMRLARTNGGTGAVTGTLNINGGTVVANSIVAGGGVSTINLNASGKLILNGAAGTLAAPIRFVSMSDGSLTVPAANGGASLAVSNLTVGGSQNVINISAIPPVSAYPITFPLITYQTGAGGNFGLGTLPAGSPAYQGSLVDTGNGVVSLRLTAGPVIDLSLRWTGATDNNWDTNTPNWLYQGNTSPFFAGGAALFTDATTQPNVNLAVALSPGSITVSNNTVAYAFTGPGNIAGAGTLTKRGAAGLTIDNQGVNNIGTVVIVGGTLQLGTGGADGALSALNITNNGTLAINRSGSLTLSSAISGSGALTKNGDGTLVLSGANTYDGATTLSAGTLELDQTTAGAGPLTAASGTTLAGNGVVNGLATVAGTLSPGAANAPGNFKAHGGLTLASGAALNFDLSSVDAGNPALNDSVEVTGNLTLNNNSLTVNFNGTPLGGASYLLFTYTGTLSGNLNPTVLGTHFAATVDTSIPGSIYLNVSGSAGSDLVWTSPSDSAWDGLALNWLTIPGSQPSAFFAGDTALLDDTAGVQQTLTIGAGGTVYPALITNSSTNNQYVINGAGHIGGSGGVVKTGTSTLVLGTANSFSGAVDVQAGTLQTDNDTALGAATAGTTIHDGATLNVNGHSLGGELITVSGAGVGGAGAIINTGGAQAQAFRQLVLAGDTTFGGSSQWGINNGGGAASLSTGGNPFKITKVGANLVTLAQLSAIDGSLGDIDIQQGTLEFSGLTPNLGDPAHTNSVQAGATLSFANNSVVWNKQFLFNGNGATTTVNNGTGANTELAGPLEIHGGCVFNVGGTLLTISGVISGDGGLLKNGGSPLVLSAVNPYTGDTTINTAALRLSGAATISGSSNVTIAAGATLTVTGRVDSAFTLVSGQALKGNGVVNGHVIESAGAVIAPGQDGIGMLTASNTITLAGTTIMELDEANATNDFLRCNSTMTYGGTLNLVSLGGPLTTGSSFKLFNASSYLGNFTALNPATPGPGQLWDLAALKTTGTISVVAANTPVPRFVTLSVVGSDLVLSGTNGPLSGAYYVRASSDIGLPVASWPRIATNAFNGSGNFSFTNAITAGLPRRYFVIELP